MSIQKLRSPKEIGAAIRRARREHGFSQIELAERANISRAGLQKIEDGRASPSVSTAMKLLRTLSLDLGVLSRDDPFASLQKEKRHDE